MLPHLLKRHSALRSTLIVGLVWGGLWHGYADYFGVSGQGTHFWLLILLLGPGKAWMPGRAEQFNRFDVPKRMFFMRSRMLGLPLVNSTFARR